MRGSRRPLLFSRCWSSTKLTAITRLPSACTHAAGPAVGCCEEFLVLLSIIKLSFTTLIRNCVSDVLTSAPLLERQPLKKSLHKPSFIQACCTRWWLGPHFCLQQNLPCIIRKNSWQKDAPTISWREGSWTHLRKILQAFLAPFLLRFYFLTKENCSFFWC